MHDDECQGVSGHHKGEIHQNSWKGTNKSVFQGVSMNSSVPRMKCDRRSFYQDLQEASLWLLYGARHSRSSKREITLCQTQHFFPLAIFLNEMWQILATCLCFKLFQIISYCTLFCILFGALDLCRLILCAFCILLFLQTLSQCSTVYMN